MGFFDDLKNKVNEVNITQGLADTKNLALGGMESGKSKAIELFEKHRPEIENILVNGLLTVAEEKLKDNETLKQVFEKGYEALPLPVRLLLPCATFVEFSMKEKEPLLLKVQEYKRKRAAGNSESTV
jgi:hypothetical protein